MNEELIYKAFEEVSKDPEIKERIEKLKETLKKYNIPDTLINATLRRIERATIGFATKYYSDITDIDLLKRSIKADYLAEIERGKKWVLEWIYGMATMPREKYEELKKALGL